MSTTCVLENYWIEENAGDGVLIENAHLVNVRNCRISGIGDGTNRAIRLKENSGSCVIDGNSAARSAGDTRYAAIELEAGSADNVIIGNSRLAPFGPLPVNFVDRNTVIGSRAFAQLPTAPTSGTWSQGDMVWNSEPIAGGALGWVCIAGGAPGTWQAMPQ